MMVSGPDTEAAKLVFGQSQKVLLCCHPSTEHSSNTFWLIHMQTADDADSQHSPYNSAMHTIVVKCWTNEH